MTKFLIRLLFIIWDLKVPYIVVTNGIVHYACKLDTEKPGYNYLNVIPLYEELNSEE